MTFVVDTNVLVVANGGDWLRTAPACVDTCVRKLQQVKDSERTVIDDGWQILGEYKDNARSSGEPGFGDAFLRWLLSNIANSDRCDCVRPADFPDDARLANFDQSDRKFVCVALAHPDKPSILNAVDSDWHAVIVPLADYGIKIDCICG